MAPAFLAMCRLATSVPSQEATGTPPSVIASSSKAWTRLGRWVPLNHFCTAEHATPILLLMEWTDVLVASHHDLSGVSQPASRSISLALMRRYIDRLATLLSKDPSMPDFCLHIRRPDYSKTITLDVGETFRIEYSRCVVCGAWFRRLAMEGAPWCAVRPEHVPVEAAKAAVEAIKAYRMAGWIP